MGPVSITAAALNTQTNCSAYMALNDWQRPRAVGPTEGCARRQGFLRNLHMHVVIEHERVQPVTEPWQQKRHYFWLETTMLNSKELVNQ